MHRYAFGAFLFLILYHSLIINRLEFWEVSEISYTYHIVDYSLGFRSQLLPGAIFYGIFREHSSQTTAAIFDTGLILFFFFGLSFLLERFLQNVEKQYRQASIVLLILYLSGPFTFAIFTDELGMLDVYWLFFSLLFFLFLDKRVLRFLIPILFALSMLIHFSSVINYIILFVTILIYKISITTNKKERLSYVFVLVLSLFVTVCLFLFFLLYHTEIALSKEDFHRFIQNRGGTYFEYYDYSFYNTFYGETVVSPDVYSLTSPLLKILRIVFEKCQFTFRLYSKSPIKVFKRLLFAIVILTPLLRFLYKHIYNYYKTISNQAKRFCLLLIMIQFPFTAIVGCMYSVDIIRWFTHAFLIFFTLFLYLAYYEAPLKTSTLETITSCRNSFPALVYFIAYFLVHSWAYC